MADAGPKLSEALFGKRADEAVWQDREIRFDLGPQELQCRRGELPLKSLVCCPASIQCHSLIHYHSLPPATALSAPLQEEVEDTKGNNGERGDLLLTNLRLLWVSKRQRRTNISVGYGCITSIVVKDASRRLKGRRRWPSPAR